MSTNIYILKLQGNRYYVGKSENPMKRYQEHLNGSGSAWTRKYKPVGIEKIIEKASPFDEDKWTKIYMSKHGMEKVRGGAYVKEELPEFQEEALKSELWSSTDKCTTCGREGHWAKDCSAKKEDKNNNNCCYRCGRPGHYASTCYAKTDKKGYELDDYDDDSDDDDESEEEEYEYRGVYNDDDSEDDGDEDDDNDDDDSEDDDY